MKTLKLRKRSKSRMTKADRQLESIQKTLLKNEETEKKMWKEIPLILFTNLMSPAFLRKRFKSVFQ